MKKLTKIISFLILLGVSFSFMAEARIERAPAPVRGIEDVIRILNTVVNWIFTILLIVAVIYIFMAAFSYLGSGGDAVKVATAQTKLIYALVAIGVALIARGLEFIVRQLVGA